MVSWVPWGPFENSQWYVASGYGFASVERWLTISQLNIIETYPAIIEYDHDVFNYFREQCVAASYVSRHIYSPNLLIRHHLCGYDINLTYPQTGGIFPTLKLTKPSKAASRATVSAASWREAISAEYTARVLNAPAKKRADFHERRAVEREQWKRDLSQRANGTIDPWYGCDLFTEMVDYALNFTFPWSAYLLILERCVYTHLISHQQRMEASTCTTSPTQRVPSLNKTQDRFLIPRRGAQRCMHPHPRTGA